MRDRQSSGIAVTATLIAVLVVLLLTFGGRRPENAVVVYCSHDSVYSEDILREFEQQTGIRVIVRFDTEATKSLGLSNQLIAERDNPLCDVFWNNEVLGTMRLQELGLLEPYRGSGWRRIPAAFKDPDGDWTGFAARLRLYIVNTDHLDATSDAIARQLDGDLSRMAVAKPLYGTTLTHYAALWHELGGEELQRRHRDARARGVVEVDGNAVVKNLVAVGRCHSGWTDSDDFYLAVDDRKPVAMLPVRIPSGATVCIPNSVSIVRGAKHRQQAERLVDFLLSAEVEIRLANSRSRQIPLGPVDDEQLPETVRRLAGIAREGVDLNELRQAHVECLKWLLSEYVE
jgi:iron(III) transport system substrate-binding protein